MHSTVRVPYPWRALQRLSFHQTPDGQELDAGEIDLHERLTTRLECNIQELADALEVETRGWRTFFAESFPIRLVKYSLRKPSSHPQLRALAEQLIETKKTQEIAALEEAVRQLR
jgi:hypothetical protein